MLQQDSRLGRSFQRGWRGYTKSIQSPVKVPEKIEIKTELETKSIGIQVTENEFDFFDGSIDSYISSLYNVMRGVSKIHLGKLITKLDELSKNLNPVDIPSPSSSPEVEELDFTDTMKSIHTKLKAQMKKREPVKEIIQIKLTGNKDTQTILRFDDLKNIEHLRIVIIEKESVIMDLNSRLRKKEEIEDMYTRKSRECEELKKALYEVKTTVCSQCNTKNKMLTEKLGEIKTLQLSVYKSISVERELEQTKNKLKSTMDVITMKNTLIQKLEEDVVILEKVVDETKIQTEELKTKLITEHESRVKLEKILATDSPNKTVLKKSLANTPLVNRPNFDALEFPNSETSHQSKTPNNHKNQEQGYFRAMTASNKFHQELRKGDSINNSPDKRRKQISDKMYGDTTIGYGDQINLQKKKERKIMDALNMTKDEYLALSQNARMKLYACLYEHKEKCGSECEHLRRAMKIRSKDRGKLFPTKKYNIS